MEDKRLDYCPNCFEFYVDNSICRKCLTKYTTMGDSRTKKRKDKSITLPMVKEFKNKEINFK